MSHEKEIEQAEDTKSEESLVESAGSDLPVSSESESSSEEAVKAPVEEGEVNETSSVDSDVSQGENPGASAEPESQVQEEAAEAGAPEAEEAESNPSSSAAPTWEVVCAAVEKINEAEEKLKLIISFMSSALSQAGTPSFKHFWEARRSCLPLFKESSNPVVRAQLWEEFSNLSKEARRLKEILDEQSAFAVEQIEVAIASLEGELADISQQLEKVAVVDVTSPLHSLEERASYYNDSQRELNLLNAYAGRINALRKELIKTEMRIRQKNKFFQRLSAVGDLVFPRRKELIKEVSEAFIADIDAFTKRHFGKNSLQAPLFQYRDEIKSLQGIAKNLTLNTHAFTHTRGSLSSCWDELKGLEKERKRDRAQKKVEFKENQDQVEAMIHEVQEKFGAQELNAEAALKELDGISSHMRKVELGRDEVKFLRDKLHEVRQPMFDEIKARDEERRRKEQEREAERQQLIAALREKIEELLQGADALEVDELVEKRSDLQKEISQLSANKASKQQLERLLKPLRDVIADKREKALLSLSDDDRQALEQLRTVLGERQRRRREIKEQLESLRKSQGSSGMDFEKALAFTEQINEEKERFEKINLGIDEVEAKIRELEAKI